MRSVSLLVFLLLHMVLAITDATDFSRRAAYNLTADFSYDSETETCCLGKVYSNPNRTFLRCCGSAVYKSDKETCCRDVIHRKVSGTTCCGRDLYDVDEAMCCVDTVHKVPRAHQFKLQNCCGSQLYNTEKELCCHDLSTGKIVKTVKRTMADSCCGTKVFNTKEQICCSNRMTEDGSIHEVVARQGKRTECCDSGKLYDPQNEICCGLNIINKDMGCCEGNVSKGYDFGKQLCCVGHNGEVTTPTKTSLKSDCCADKVYNIDTRQCCGQDLINYNDEDLRCCGNEVIYDSKTEGCHILNNGKWVVAKKSDHTPDDMCGSTPYNKKFHKCCRLKNGREVLSSKRSESSNSCCADVTYDNNRFICCSAGEIYRLYGEVRNTDCCGLEPYDYTTHVCCNGSVTAIKTGKTIACCGEAGAYNTETEVCCTSYLPLGYGIIPKSDETGCCGTKSFDKSQEICCKSRVYHKTKNGLACCDDKTYDTETHVCCEKDIVPRKKGRKIECCFKTTTNQNDFDGEYPWFH